MKISAYYLSLAFFLFLVTQCSTRLTTTHALELTDLSIEYNEAVGTNRNRLLPSDSTKKGELNLNMAVRTSEWTYTNAKVESQIDTSQFRTIGLKVESGLRYKIVELYLYHHSQHVIDTVDLRGKYPNENSIGVRIKLCCK